MKNLILTLITLLCVQTSFSQVKNIEYSTPFEEPEKGWYKVMQLSNGYTFYFNFNNDEGIVVSVYKPDRKLATRKTLSSKVWEPKEMKNSTIEGIYEMNGQPVIFLQQVIGREPVLYRIQLNPENGAIVAQKEIGRLPKYKLMAGYAMAFGNVDPVDFIVEKDPYSDAYAVVLYNSFAKESDARIELVHYAVENGEHMEINRSFYDAQDFKYTNYIGMTVHGDKVVHMAAYGYNTEGSGGKDSRVIISRMKRGVKQFTNVNLEFTDDFKETEGLMNYNPETGMIQMLTLTLLQTKNKAGFSSTQTKSYYMAMISYIDPESLQIIKKIDLPIEGLSNYVQSKKIADNYTGLPVNMILNNDNTTTILMEEKYETSRSYGSTSYFGRKAAASSNPNTEIMLSNAGVIKLDNSGKDIEAYAIQKKQIAKGMPLENMYLAKRGKGLWSYRKRAGGTLYSVDNRSFYSYDYVNTSGNNSYIIFNDNTENYENGQPVQDKKGAVRGIEAVSESVTVFRKVNNNKVETGYLFGRNANDDQTAFCNLESADFKKDTGVYAVLMVKRNKKEKKAYISWITLE